jgi:hypothetical protein
MRKTNRIRRFAFTAALAAFLASGAYAFTASNTVPGTQVGAGSGTISGYTATNVQYTLDPTTPTNVNAVAFTIAPVTTSAVKVQLASGGAWYSCTNTAGAVSCATLSPQATAAAATQLTVVAAQ